MKVKKVTFFLNEVGTWEASFEGLVLPKDIGLIKRAMQVGYRKYLRDQKLGAGSETSVENNNATRKTETS